MKTDNKPFPRQNGEMTIKLPWQQLWAVLKFHGGPYAMAYVPSPNSYGVVLVERAGQMVRDAHMPIVDFSVPSGSVDSVQAVIRDAIFAALDGKDVFVGCLGGWGRTGLMLSLIAKTLGVSSPVEYVREVYTPKAVETMEQYAYVSTFPVEDLRKAIFWRRFWSIFSINLSGRWGPNSVKLRIGDEY